MATAVSSLLPDGELVYYHYRSYDIPVTLKSHDVVSNAGTGGRNLYPEEKLNVPVAILTDDMTASSGALTLCFRGLENTRTFGAPTAGYTSVNMLHNMYDGAQMYLTSRLTRHARARYSRDTNQAGCRHRLLLKRLLIG